MKLTIFISLLLVIEYCEAWIVLDFPQIKEYYINERASTYFGGSDPFFKKRTRELKSYCEELRKSATYGIWSSNNEPLPPVIVAPRTPAKRQTLEHRYRYQKVNELRYPVPMFPCLTHANDGYWYLSYGFNDDRLFIFTPTTPNDHSRGPVFEIKGLLERNPKIDRRVQRPSVLEMAFWNSVASNKGILPDLKGRSSEHFRLCSLVFDTLKNFYNPSKGYTINFAPVYDSQSSVIRPMMFENMMKKRDLFVNAIPCAINRSFTRPNFYIIPDTSEPQSIFVLMEKEDFTDGQVKFVVKYYLRDVSVLKNWPSKLVARM